MDLHILFHQFVWFFLLLNLYKLFTYQWEVVGINPDDAEVRKVSVFPGNLFQDLQELITIWKK